MPRDNDNKPRFCDGTISGVPGGSNNRCPNPAKMRVIETKLVTYWDTEEVDTFMCPTHYNVYLVENDVTSSELVSEGWARELP